MPRFKFFLSGMLWMSASLASGQNASSPPNQSPSTARDLGARGKTDPRSHQTAEDLLRALQADRPVNEVIVPASRSVNRLGADAHLLLPEGTAIIEKPGRLVRQGSGWDFQPDDGKSISVLPNAALEDMLAMKKGADGDILFVVSGEVTIFGDQNFLLIKTVTRGSAQATPGPAGSAGSPSLSADASAEDVLSALQSQRPVGSDVVGSGRDSAERPSSVNAGAALDGALVVRRSGRLIRHGSRWSFEFDDKSVIGRGSLAVLPNQSLEIMVQSAERGSSGLAFIVSGEITQFGSENYLLVRGLTRVLDLGNLRP